ncbi:MAG: ATPase, partial [Spirochaetaceae bacterium]|nr:ATPase [Spirochaetaceae bacterium]
SETLKEIDEIHRITGRIKDLHASLGKVRQQIEMLKPYGDFEPADLDILRSQGVDIRLFDADDSMVNELAGAGGTIFVLRRKKKKVLFAAVFTGEAPDESVGESVELPEYGIQELLTLKEDMLSELSDLQKMLTEHSRRKPVLEYYLAKIEQDLEFEALSSGTDGDGALIWVSGFIPEGDLPGIRELASVEGWGLLIRDPTPEDPIPTLINNGPTIRIIQPVFDFLGTLPGYREYDISLYFLSYFSIFFAMIVGDAGYGVLFFLGAFYLAIKSIKSDGGLPDAIKLLFVLSIATIAWGTITGNWFGSKTIASLPFLQQLTIPSIATFPELFPDVEVDPQKTIMWLCFLLGLSQLTLANVMNFIRDFPKLKAFSYLGWGSVIGGLYFLV